MSNSDFISWDQDVSEDAKESKGAIIHKAGEYNFKVVVFEKGIVNNPESKYNKGYIAKLELNVEGAKVFENLILHKNLDWKIGALFRSLGLMNVPANERWSKVLGSTGRVKVKVEQYVKDGNKHDKNVVDFFLDKAPQKENAEQNSQNETAPEKQPWE